LAFIQEANREVVLTEIAERESASSAKEHFEFKLLIE
jgi:hypothetical protein